MSSAESGLGEALLRPELVQSDEGDLSSWSQLELTKGASSIPLLHISIEELPIDETVVFDHGESIEQEGTLVNTERSES